MLLAGLQRFQPTLLAQAVAACATTGAWCVRQGDDRQLPASDGCVVPAAGCSFEGTHRRCVLPAAWEQADACSADTGRRSRRRAFADYRPSPPRPPAPPPPPLPNTCHVFSEEMLLDEVARHVMCDDVMAALSAADVADLACGMAALDHSPGVTLFEALAARAAQLRGDLSPQRQQEVRQRGRGSAGWREAATPEGGGAQAALPAWAALLTGRRPALTTALLCPPETAQVRAAFEALGYADYAPF